MRTDGDVLSLEPSLPPRWGSYRFRVCYQGAVLEVRVHRDRVELQVFRGPAVTIRLYGKRCTVGAEGMSVPLLQPAA